MRFLFRVLHSYQTQRLKNSFVTFLIDHYYLLIIGVSVLNMHTRLYVAPEDIRLLRIQDNCIEQQ